MNIHPFGLLPVDVTHVYLRPQPLRVRLLHLLVLGLEQYGGVPLPVVEHVPIYQDQHRRRRLSRRTRNTACIALIANIVRSFDRNSQGCIEP